MRYADHESNVRDRRFDPPVNNEISLPILETLLLKWISIATGHITDAAPDAPVNRSKPRRSSFAVAETALASAPETQGPQIVRCLCRGYVEHERTSALGWGAPEPEASRVVGARLSSPASGGRAAHSY